MRAATLPVRALGSTALFLTAALLAMGCGGEEQNEGSSALEGITVLEDEGPAPETQSADTRAFDNAMKAVLDYCHFNTPEVGHAEFLTALDTMNRLYYEDPDATMPVFVDEVITREEAIANAAIIVEECSPEDVDRLGY